MVEVPPGAHPVLAAVVALVLLFPEGAFLQHLAELFQVVVVRASTLVLVVFLHVLGAWSQSMRLLGDVLDMLNPVERKSGKPRRTCQSRPRF